MSRPAIGRSTARVPEVAGLEAAVLIPVAVGQLDEADTRFDEPPRQQTLVAKVGGHRIVEAIQAPGRDRLALQVHDAGERPLHAERQLVGLDDPVHAGMDTLTLKHGAVQRLNKVKLQALSCGVETRVPDVADLGLGDGHRLVADASRLASRR